MIQMPKWKEIIDENPNFRKKYYKKRIAQKERLSANDLTINGNTYITTVTGFSFSRTVKIQIRILL